MCIRIFKVLFASVLYPECVSVCVCLRITPCYLCMWPSPLRVGRQALHNTFISFVK